MSVEQVSIPTFDRIDLKAIARADWEDARSGCQAHVYWPQHRQQGPLPAIVIAQGLGGPLDTREHRYARMLCDEGYVALVIDSFGSRDVGRFGDMIRALKVSAAMMLADAMGGLRFLGQQPEIDRDRIGIMGFSYGGMISLLSVYEQMRRVFFPGREMGFAAHASLYGCSVPRLEDPTTTGAPALVMLGDKDTNVSVERTKVIVEDLRRGGSPVTFELFENAYHQWDNDDTEPRRFPISLKDCKARVDHDNNINCERFGIPLTNRVGRAAFMAASMSFKGFTMLRNEDVLATSDAMLKKFFADHLKAREVRPSLVA